MSDATDIAELKAALEPFAYAFLQMLSEQREGWQPSNAAEMLEALKFPVATNDRLWEDFREAAAALERLQDRAVGSAVDEMLARARA